MSIWLTGKLETNIRPRVTAVYHWIHKGFWRTNVFDKYQDITLEDCQTGEEFIGLQHWILMATYEGRILVRAGRLSTEPMEHFSFKLFRDSELLQSFHTHSIGSVVVLEPVEIIDYTSKANRFVIDDEDLDLTKLNATRDQNITQTSR